MPYIAKEIYREDPTVSIDQTGVGRLMQMGVDDARVVNPNIKLGICQAGRRSRQREVVRGAGPDVCLVLAQARAGGAAGGGAGGAGE